MFYVCTCIKIQRLSNGFFLISTNSLVFKENQWKKLFSYFTACFKMYFRIYILSEVYNI